jgi:arylsulfatase A-like enzyme
VFHEGLALASASGVATHAALGLAVAVVATATVLGLGALRRRHGRWAVAALAAALVGLAGAVGWSMTPARAPQVVRRPAPPAAAGKPNLMLVVVDTLRADAVEPFGPAAGTTPAVARLASDGVAFERTYAQSSWTRPSIASILTGQYPSRHGAVHKMDILPEAATTLAEVLRAAGYWTAAFVNNINVAPVFNFQQGFDEYVYLEPEFYFGATDSAAKLAIYKGLRLARERFFGRRMYFQHYYQDAQVVNRRVLGWLDEKPPEPFFLLVHYMDPHDPYFEIPYTGRGVARVMHPSPPPESAAELRELYRQEVRYLDDALHVLFDRLRGSGLYERTAIVLTADHGEEFQEHGGWWHGTTLYEEAIRVPLIIKPVQGRDRGLRRPDPARTIDIAPTLLAAAGVAAPPGVQGGDLFNGHVTEPLYAEEDLEGNRLAAIQVGDWKLITANADNPRGLEPLELYNLAADPGERTNLAGREATRARGLLDELARFTDHVTGQTRRARPGGDHAADPRT